MSDPVDNPQLQLAFDFVHHTGKNLFLTGKAGTGKTTFLRTLKERSPKRMIVVAPTGVAAINAGGVTIHSFFQMPFGPLVPDANPLDGRGNAGRPEASSASVKKKSTSSAAWTCWSSTRSVWSAPTCSTASTPCCGACVPAAFLSAACNC